MGAKIKNIIFDLGGVLLNLDYQLTTEAFIQLGIPHFRQLYSQFKANDIFNELETGKISNQDFYKNIKAACKVDISNTQIDAAWNAMLLNFRVESLQYLTSIKNKYNLFLLSNTNAIHLQKVNEILLQQTNQINLNNYFHHSYYSHLIGMRKPSTEIYNHVLTHQNLVAAETLFIDDLEQNIIAARLTGIKSHWLQPIETIIDVIDKIK
jgi:glucose-1-phosphatase